MNYFFLDASALVKQYHKEPGADVLSVLFETLLEMDAKRLVLSPVALAETIAAWYRQGRQDRIPDALLDHVSDQILEDSLRVSRCHVSDDVVISSIPLIPRHAINSSDAVLLEQALLFSRDMRQVSRSLVFVAADKRLLRAAAAERLATLDVLTCTLEHTLDLLAEV